ncbi:MAG: response regulator [Verrucomicrobia bacterium]|nr:response regulator [Verrucomicrobiota bacterium]
MAIAGKNTTTLAGASALFPLCELRTASLYDGQEEDNLSRRLDNLQIVVVDDHKQVRSAMAGFLSGLGAIVYECSNADDALEVVVRLQPALVVSDIAMPGKDGFELLQEIRSLSLPGAGEVPVIAITGLSRPLDQMRVPAAGFNALLLKPFTPDALLRVISELLEV